MTHRRWDRVERHDALAQEWVTCDGCGKRGYQRRKAAKQAGRELGGVHLSTYVCPDSGLWHIGHLPAAVRRGDLPKDVYLSRVDAKAARQ